ncbi:MAG: PfkB family carbohydrate kinase [Candidatus Melainabacteria bacterium]|nr:PfkB family carbohydrate kinase [Candidatus Melainabacteria bacterium]
MQVDILVIGEPLVELSSQSDVQKSGTYIKGFGGDTLNTAVAAARLGSSVAYITRLGNDPFAQELRDLIRAEGIQTQNFTKNVSGTTGLYLVNVKANGERSFLYYRQGSAASTLHPDDINLDQIRQSAVVYSTGVTLAISESAQQATLKAFKLAKEAGIPTVFDPNYRPALWSKPSEALDAYDALMPYVDIILPTYPEDTLLMMALDQPEYIVDFFIAKGVKLVALKAGAQGAYVGFKHLIEHCPATTGITVTDTTGAGDAFNAGFLHGLTQRRPVMDCARLGVTTAGLKVQRQGAVTAMPYRDTVYSKVTLQPTSSAPGASNMGASQTTANPSSVNATAHSHSSNSAKLTLPASRPMSPIVPGSTADNEAATVTNLAEKPIVLQSPGMMTPSLMNAPTTEPAHTVGGLNPAGGPSSVGLNLAATPNLAQRPLKLEPPQAPTDTDVL